MILSVQNNFDINLNFSKQYSCQLMMNNTSLFDDLSENTSQYNISGSSLVSSQVTGIAFCLIALPCIVPNVMCFVCLIKSKEVNRSSAYTLFLTNIALANICQLISFYVVGVLPLFFQLQVK